MKKNLTPVIVLITIIAYSQNTTIQNWSNKNILLHKSEVTHNNYDLDNTLNFSDADIVASYPNCQDKNTNIAKTNCFNTNLTIHITNGLTNSSIIKNSHLKKGLIKVRILLIIDTNGKIHVKKILGKCPNEISNEISRIVESAPKLIPAKLSGNNIAVKYSIKIPFIIK
jgi:hypothetical protein